MSSADVQRLEQVGRAYCRSLLQAANANVKLGEHKLAKRQYLELLELVRDEHLCSEIHRKLKEPETAVCDLATRSLTSTGRTVWDFDDGNNDQHFAPVPIQGVQTDPRSCCPLVRSPSRVIDTALALAQVSPSDVLLDLGCGDGRMLVRCAESLGARAVGVDVNPYCIERSRAAAKRACVSHLVTVINHDLLTMDSHPCFADVSVVYVYLVPKAIDALQPLLRQAVKAGKRVCIYCTSGCNGVQGVAPVTEAMRGMLRLYSSC